MIVKMNELLISQNVLSKTLKKNRNVLIRLIACIWINYNTYIFNIFIRSRRPDALYFSTLSLETLICPKDDINLKAIHSSIMLKWCSATMHFTLQSGPVFYLGAHKFIKTTMDTRNMFESFNTNRRRRLQRR